MASMPQPPVIADAPVPRMPLVALIFGSSMLAFGPLLVRLSDVSTASSAFWRMALAVPVLVLVAAFNRGASPISLRGLPWGVAALGGLFFGADLLSWHAGIVRTTAANATLFGNCAAFMLAGWALLVKKEPAQRSTLQSLGLAAAGTLLLLGNSAQLSSENFVGDLLCLLAAAFYMLYFLAIIRLRERLPTATVLAMSTLLSSLMLLPVALLSPGQFWPGDWTPLLGLALSSQLIGQGLMVYASGKLPAPILGLGLLVQPLVSATTGWLAFGEALGAIEFLGAGMIAAALVMVRR